MYFFIFRRDAQIKSKLYARLKLDSHVPFVKEYSLSTNGRNLVYAKKNCSLRSRALHAHDGRSQL